MNPPGGEIQLNIRTSHETRRLGRCLGHLCRPGDWIGLQGELGAGKTCLIQGLARGLGVDRSVPVTSPTFVLRQTYLGRFKLFHLDLYRLSSPVELEDLGYAELCDGEGVCVVEWCDRVSTANPGRGLLMTLAIIDQRTRRIRIEALDQRGRDLLQQLRKPCRLLKGVTK